MNLAHTKYSYAELMELSIYSDLKGTLKANDRLLLNSDSEFEKVKDILSSESIPFMVKTKREISIAPEVL